MFHVREINFESLKSENKSLINNTSCFHPNIKIIYIKKDYQKNKPKEIPVGFA